ncbi:MAG: VPLPA-CTERM sorting domain-containing protein, partial [Thiogranum sp.]
NSTLGLLANLQVAVIPFGANPDPLVTGDAPVASLTFTVLGNAGTTEITVSDSALLGGWSPALTEAYVPGSVTVVPVPAAVWLFGSGLLGLVGVARRRRA